jgi:hypothetical protein
MTPVMKAGVTDRLWSTVDIVGWWAIKMFDGSRSPG